MIVFLDACALIYWQEVKEPFYSQFIATLTKSYEQHPAAKIAVSRLSQLECLVKPYKDNNFGYQLNAGHGRDLTVRPEPVEG